MTSQVHTGKYTYVVTSSLRPVHIKVFGGGRVHESTFSAVGTFFFLFSETLLLINAVNAREVAYGKSLNEGYSYFHEY